jgi:hypothetical protein
MSAVLDQASKPAAVTNLAALRTPPPDSQMPVVTMGFGSLQSFDLMQRGAKLLAASTLVPKEYQNNIPNCVIALNMAQRIGADPLMVMQNLYVVHGRPGWSAQFLIATFNQCGRFTAMRFEFVGERGKDSWGCRAWALEKSTNEKIVGALITVGLAKAEGWHGKTGSKWKTMEEQMLMYRSASWLVRAYAPEIAMGLQTAEELRDVYDASDDGEGNFVVSSVTDLKAGESATIDQATGEVTTDAPPNAPNVGALYQEALALAKKGTDLCLDLCRDLPDQMANEIREAFSHATVSNNFDKPAQK